MKKFKKSLALSLVLIMAVSAWGCGKKNDPVATPATEETTEAPADETEAPAETAEVAPEVEIPENEIIGDENVENPFYVYSWNTELGDRLNYFRDANPDLAARIVYVNTGGSDFYQDKVDALLATPDNKQYPDLIALEAAYMLKYTNSEYTLPVSDLGITDADMANMYPYTVELAKVDGTVKALSWQAAPGSMMYRRSLAEKYLGVSEPEDVQAYFKDWNTLIESARTIDKESAGATKLFSGNDDVSLVFQASRSNAWITDDVLTVDDKMIEYMDYAKILEEENLTNKTAQWSDAWNANCANDSTFAYMGCTWFLHWVIKANSGGEKVGEGTFGDWAMCQGPQTYYWGGTWLAATAGCSDTELAGLIMKTTTCDTDTMAKMCDETMDYVNNKAAVKKLIDDGKGAYDFLGGQNYLEVFSPLADNITIPKMTAEDFYINSSFATQVLEYSTGAKDKDTALADFKTAVIDLYPYLSAE